MCGFAADKRLHNLEKKLRFVPVFNNVGCHPERSEGSGKNTNLSEKIPRNTLQLIQGMTRRLSQFFKCRRRHSGDFFKLVGQM